LLQFRYKGAWKLLSHVASIPGFSGFLFEDGFVCGVPAIPHDGRAVSSVTLADLELGNASIANATHVLIRSQHE